MPTHKKESVQTDALRWRDATRHDTFRRLLAGGDQYLQDHPAALVVRLIVDWDLLRNVMIERYPTLDPCDIPRGQSSWSLTDLVKHKFAIEDAKVASLLAENTRLKDEYSIRVGHVRDLTCDLAQVKAQHASDLARDAGEIKAASRALEVTANAYRRAHATVEVLSRLLHASIDNVLAAVEKV